MKTASILLALFLLSTRLGLAVGMAPIEPKYRDSEILVKFRAGVKEKEITALEQDFALSKMHRFDGIGVCHYWLPPGMTVPEAVALLLQEERVAFAEPNFFRARCGFDNPHTNQWYLKNTGQKVNGSTGPAGNDINWTAAIGKFTGTTNSVIVAVVDTGVALDHEDLLGNLWTNPAETLNGRDDDGNGLVDDLFGYDFVKNDPEPYDEFGHGTLVAGIIGAVADNGRGMVGICPRAKIMPLRVLDQSGLGTVAEIIPALAYARQKGAKIINCSFGGTGFSSSEQAAFAALHDAGILVVCAAGNGGDDGVGDNNDQAPLYPASYNLPNMITAAAVDRTLALASFSNYGVNSVQVAAPGTDMYSAEVTRIGVFQDGFQNGGAGWTSGGDGRSYRWGFLTTNSNTYLSDGSWTPQNRDLAPYLPGTDTWMRSPRISLAASIGSQLSFSAAYDLADDLVWVETSTDTVDWIPLGYLYGSSSSTWRPIRADLSSADGQDLYFRFHLISNESLQGSGISIDDISITRVSVRSDGQSADYGFNDGTSFAAPVVSGVAALALAQRPDITYAAVKNLILANTRPVAALAGKVTTGGMVDANRVMTALPSVPVGPLAPVITANPKSQMVSAGATASFSVSAIGPAPLTYQWLFNGQPISAATDATYTIPRAGFSDAGSYAAVVSNSYSSVKSAAATLTVDGTTAYGVIGVPFSYQIAANNNPTGFSASGLPTGLRCDTSSGLISGIPTETGTFHVRVEAKSIFGSASATIVISIIEGAITSATSADGVVGVPFSYQITADNDPTGFSASGLPPGFRCDSSSGVILGIPTSAGTFQVRVEAKSIFGSASATIIITIDDGSITSATDADGIVGVPFTYQISADNDPTGFSASGLPPGFRCDNSGLISGTPMSAGTFQVRVEAKSIFASASATIVITIREGSIPGGARPTLTVSRAGNNILLAWPVTSDLFILEETEVGQNHWTNSSAKALIQGNQNVAIIPAQRAVKLYRLRK